MAGLIKTYSKGAKKMKRAIAPMGISALCLLCLLIGIGVSAQQEVKVEAPKSVRQGDNVNFQITTDKPASVPGGVGLQVSDAGGHVFNSSNYALNGSVVRVTMTIPLDSKAGKWKVVKVTFTPGAGGETKDLTPDGDLIFEVLPHEPVVYPSRARVEIR
jgi:hypothetical protein